MSAAKSFLLGKISGLLLGSALGLLIGPLFALAYAEFDGGHEIPLAGAIFGGGFAGGVVGAALGTALGLVLAWGQLAQYGTQIGLAAGATLGLIGVTLFAPDPAYQPFLLPLLGLAWGSGLGWGSGRFLEYLSAQAP